MKQSQRWNNLQICPHRDLNMGGSDLWSNMLPLDHRDAHLLLWVNHIFRSTNSFIKIDFTVHVWVKFKKPSFDQSWSRTCHFNLVRHVLFLLFSDGSVYFDWRRRLCACSRRLHRHQDNGRYHSLRCLPVANSYRWTDRRRQTSPSSSFLCILCHKDWNVWF